MQFEFGDVVLVPFPFTSHTASKAFPCIIFRLEVGSMSAKAKSVKAVEPPVKIDGGVSRLVRFTDGSARIETWSKGGWAPGGASAAELMAAPKASPAFLASLGVPS